MGRLRNGQAIIQLKQHMYRCGEAEDQGSLQRCELTVLIPKLVRHVMLLRQREKDE